MTKRRKKNAKKRKTFNIGYLVLGIVILIVIILISSMIKGCGVSHKSPVGVVEALIKASVAGKESKMKDCYGAKKDAPKELETEITSTINYFKAHDPKEVKINECEVLSENKNSAYVYIVYNLKLQDEQEYPCISTYMVGKEDKKYNVLPPSKITDEMSKQAVSDYAKFMTTDTYKNYTKSYDTFIKKNPGYEEKIAGKIK